MKQKIVSFKVAKAIKKAGYSQNICRHWYNEIGTEYEWCGNIEELEAIIFENDVIAPTYLDVWLWLWREKGMRLSVEYAKVSETEFESWTTLNQEHLPKVPTSNGDPEEAIASAIEYIVDSNLLK